MVAAWVLFGTVASCGLGLAAGVVLLWGQGPHCPSQEQAAGRWQEQPEAWAPGLPWSLDEARLGISPRSGLVAGELGTGRAGDANGGDEW